MKRGGGGEILFQILQTFEVEQHNPISKWSASARCQLDSIIHVSIFMGSLSAISPPYT